MALSVCLLTRNEERNIGRAVQSVRRFVDEVLVADTGSADCTADIAAQNGARVVQVDWQDDFAAARDFAQAQARGDWILWLNPDEEVLATSGPLLQRATRTPGVFAFAVRIQEQMHHGQPLAFTETHQIRLYQRHPQLRSIGRLHPRFVPSIEELAAQEGQQISAADIAIRHHAYLSRLTESKLRWAARLLELELRDRPGQLHYLIEYGRTLLHLKDPRAHAVLAEAVDLIIPYRYHPTPPAAEIQRLLEYLLTVPPELSQSKLNREEARELAVAWFPNSPPLVWRNAQHYFLQKEFARARTLLEQLLEFGRSGAYDRTEGFEPSIIGDAARMNLGICYLNLHLLDPPRSASCRF